MPLDYTRMREQAARLNELSDRQFKVLEQRARRVAERQGLRLERSKRRDPQARDYGLYWLVDEQNRVVVGAETGTYSMTLDKVVEWLLSEDKGTTPEPRRRKSPAKAA